jgi:hypothetical protein
LYQNESEKDGEGNWISTSTSDFLSSYRH